MRRNDSLPKGSIYKVRLLYNQHAGDGPYDESPILYHRGEVVYCYAEEDATLVIRDKDYYLPLDWDEYEILT